jgi:hypothetical protein
LRREQLKPAVVDSIPYFVDGFGKYLKLIDYNFDDMRMVSAFDSFAKGNFDSLPLVSD